MRISLSGILERIPAKEKLYFIFAVIVALYFAQATPLASADYATLRTEAINSNAGIYDSNAIEQHLATANTPPQTHDSGGGDVLRQRVAERIKVYSPDALTRGGRNLFLGGSERQYPMPPLSLEFPDLPPLPAFDVPNGDAPATRLQERPTIKDTRPVKLVNDDDTNPFDFDDR